MNLAHNFSDFIYRERKKRKLSQVELTKLTGLTRSTLSKIEADAEQVTLANVEKLLSGLNLTIDDFNKYLNALYRVER